jgi:DNA-binding MarR family transcriptional regulator
MKFEDVRMISDTCLCANVQRAARSIGRRYDEAFRPLGLTNWQFTLMVATFRPEPPTINALAEALATDRTTITANLKPLEGRGLVSVQPDARDKRVRRVSLTEAGSRLLQEAYAAWREVQTEVEQGLALPNIAGFRDNLRAVAKV